jgi:hypothetical protein
MFCHTPEVFSAQTLQLPPIMKIRLTPHYSEYIKKVELKLTNPFSVDTRILYSMFPEKGNGHFSVQLIGSRQPCMILRRWTQDLSMNIELGIYQLNNISIDEKMIDISPSHYQEICSLSDSNMEVNDIKGIMTGGADHSLIIFRQPPRKFHWKDDAQIGGTTKELVDRLCDRIKVLDES